MIQLNVYFIDRGQEMFYCCKPQKQNIKTVSKVRMLLYTVKLKT